MSPVHMSQLAQYMSTTPLGEYRRPYASVGVLIDQYAIHLAFSVMAYDGGTSNKILPLPIILITPRLEWRVESTARRHVCVLLALLSIFHIERSKQDATLWRRGLGEKAWNSAVTVAEAVDRENFTIVPHTRTEPHTVHKDVQELKERVATFYEEFDQFRQVVQNVVSPPREKPNSEKPRGKKRKLAESDLQQM